MFLFATFFTTAGNNSDAFFPLAMSWMKTENVSVSPISFCPTMTPQFVVSNYSTTCKNTFVHPYDPLHGLQLERLLVALQHLLKLIVPTRTNRMQSYPDQRTTANNTQPLNY